MPYMTVANGDNFDVYKQDADGKQTGKALNKKPMTKAQASSYMSAMMANESKSLTDAELVAIEEKCYNDVNYVNKLDKNDSRVAYDARGGLVGDRGCASCRWYHPGSASCDLVYGEIVATGVSKLWLSAETPQSTVTPIPVVIVESVDAGEMSKPGIIPASSEVASKFNKSLIDKFMDFISGNKATEELPDVSDGFKVSPDGRWRAWWTNNAKDLVKENFSAKSIDDYIARVDKGIVPYPELWYKHLPVRMGKADALARIGYMTFATGTFHDTPIGQKAKAYYLAEQAAGHPKTNSHGFLYPTNLKSNGVYHAFNTFEITVLDPGEEANPYTLFEVKTMFAKVSEDTKKFEELVKIFGKEEVEKLVNFGETKSRELEQTPGVDLKSLEKFDDVVVQDKSAHEAIKALGDATLAGLKKIGDRLDEISNAVATNQKAADDKAEASLKAIADLKSYVDEQFGYTPRASKAAQTQLAKDNAQVAQLKQANADAGKKTGEEADPIAPETKSIFDHILAAAKTGAQ